MTETIRSSSPETMTPSRKKSLEGTIVTGRGLLSYEFQLAFSRELLQNETVLNFGPGYTHLGKSLQKKGISCNVVDLDVTPEPKPNNQKVLRFIATIPTRAYAKIAGTVGLFDQERMSKLQKKAEGTEGRNYVQYDGRTIPFGNQSFDHVLALWSTYQIPAENKEGVYRELLRVGKHIHMGPIYQKDFIILERLSEELGFDIIACQPIDTLPIKRVLGKAPRFRSRKDYDTYKETHMPEQRIKIPIAKDTLVAIRHAGALGVGGSTMILKKRDFTS